MGSTVHHQSQTDLILLLEKPQNITEDTPNEPITKSIPVIQLFGCLWLSIQSGLGLLFTGRRPPMADDVLF